MVNPQESSALGSLKIVVHGPEFTPSTLAMPGLFPGRVIDVSHPQPIRDRRIDQAAVRSMLTQGMAALTGDEKPADAWARFVSPADIVAIKVNPRAPRPR